MMEIWLGVGVWLERTNYKVMPRYVKGYSYILTELIAAKVIQENQVFDANVDQ